MRLVLVLVIIVISWFLLSQVASEAGATVQGQTPIDNYNIAIAWAKDLLGLAGAFAGFLGIAAAGRRSRDNLVDRAQDAEGGMFGVLAGATLLGAGGWATPIALTGLVIGGAAARIAVVLRGIQDSGGGQQSGPSIRLG